MNDSVMLLMIVLFIGFVFFPKSWFHCIWGLLMGFAVSIPLLLEVFNGTNNMIAIVFDSILFIVDLWLFWFPNL